MREVFGRECLSKCLSGGLKCGETKKDTIRELNHLVKWNRRTDRGNVRKNNCRMSKDSRPSSR